MARARSTAHDEGFDPSALHMRGGRHGGGNGDPPGSPSPRPDPPRRDGPNGTARSPRRTGTAPSSAIDPHAVSGSLPRIAFDIRIAAWRLGAATVCGGACLALAFAQSGAAAALAASFGVLLSWEAGSALRAFRCLRRRHLLLSLASDPSLRCAGPLDEAMLLIRLSQKDLGGA